MGVDEYGHVTPCDIMPEIKVSFALLYEKGSERFSGEMGKQLALLEKGKQNDNAG